MTLWSSQCPKAPLNKQPRLWPYCFWIKVLEQLYWSSEKTFILIFCQPMGLAKPQWSQLTCCLLKDNSISIHWGRLVDSDMTHWDRIDLNNLEALRSEYNGNKETIKHRLTENGHLIISPLFILSCLLIISLFASFPPPAPHSLIFSGRLREQGRF